MYCQAGVLVTVCVPSVKAIHEAAGVNPGYPTAKTWYTFASSAVGQAVNLPSLKSSAPRVLALEALQQISTSSFQQNESPEELVG